MTLTLRKRKIKTMVFKRPRSNKDEGQSRSSNRFSNSSERPKRPSSTNKTSSTSNTGSVAGKRQARPRTTEDTGEKKRFSSSGSKPPYQSRSEGGDKPASSFSASDRGGFKGRKTPYTGRATDSSAGGGEKRSFGEKKKPYSGRFTEGDSQPKKRFGEGSSEGKRPFSSFDKKTSPRSSSSGSDRPERGGFKKQFNDKPFKTDKAKTSYDRISPDLDAPAKTIRGRKKGPEPKETGLIRLNRYISNAGICSRRKADELIAAGVVSVNGVVISELGHKVDPQKDEIRYNGELLKREKMVYVLLNKPKDYITTTEDPHERRTVMHLVEKASKERIYPIGRLDRNTTGLLLMTNDGDLADKLSHPKNNISKLYQVELNKSLTQGDLNKIGFGLELEDGFIKPDSISYVAGGTKREVGIQIHSGKNRIVRRIFEHLGYEVVKLDRVVYANLTKKDLPRGRWRYLEESEVIQLKHLI